MTQRSSLSLWSLLPQGPPAPGTRYRHACCSHKGDVYLLGGRERMVLRDFWKYSVVRNDWTKLDCSSEWAPEELEGHTMVSHQGILYVFGGLIDSAYTDWKNPLWLFDIEKEEWRYSEGQIQPSQPAPVNRKGHSAVVFGSAMYIYGGYIDIRGPSQEFWKYEFDTGVWSLLSGVQAEQGPGPRHGHAAVAHQHSMYLYGGLSGLREQRDLWRWCLTNHTWSYIRTHSGPSKLVGHSMVLYRDSVLLFGGGETQNSPLNSLWRLNLPSHVWEKVAAIKTSNPPGRIHHCAVGLGPGFQSSGCTTGLADSPSGSPTSSKFRPFKNKLSPAPRPLLEGAIELQTLQLDKRGLKDSEEDLREDRLKRPCLMFENQDAFQKHWDMEEVSDCSEESIEQHLPEALLVIGGKPLSGQATISVWQMTL
ncbi:host cell factor 2 [Alosa pseudoharengus]|uniref:host cell factor 2 n=1 Tax=Alosa pseudoharengus TaxID=34774 RepID=UPI003F8871D9